MYWSQWDLHAPRDMIDHNIPNCMKEVASWWRHQMETFSALLAICAGNSPVTGEFPTQRPVTRSFDVYFDLRPKERLSKQWWGWWFETLSRSLWRHRNVTYAMSKYKWAPVSWSGVAAFHLAAYVCTSSNDKELMGADKACVLTHVYH